MTRGGRVVADLLHEAGVRRLYTVPGESFLGLLAGVDAHPGLQLISTRHESGASFMADAEAKMTGRPAVVAATRGVGASNLAIGVHTAFQDSSPMVVFLGQTDSGFLGRESFQEIDLEAFYRPITKWTATVHRTDRIPEMLSRALRIAQSGRPGPVMINVPSDLLEAEVPSAEIELGRRGISGRLSAPAPDPEMCRLIADRLRTAARPVIIAGGGARQARAELIALAERYSVGVYAGFRRQDVFPNDHPNYLGHLGLGNVAAGLTALREADLVLVVGSRLSEITTDGYTLPVTTSAMAQIDIDPAVIGTIFPAELGLVADARSALAALVSLAGTAEMPTHDWSRARAAFEETARIPAARPTDRVDTSQVLAAMRQVLPADVVISNDAGNFASFLHRYWLYRHPFTQVAPCNGAMGYAVPGAIGAKLAAPHRSVVALAGDGGFTMTALELETAVREQLDITVIVMRNGLQGTIAMHQARYDGRLAGVDIGNIEIADLARSLGAFGMKVGGADDLVGALEQAYRTPGPAVLEVLTDPQLIAPTSVLGIVSR